MLFLILTTLVACLTVFYIARVSYKNLDYWKKRGVKYVEPLPFVGNMLPTIINSITMPDFLVKIYNSFPNERFVGFYQFGDPVLMIRDPELIKSVTIKNFESFVDHTGFIGADIDVLWGKNLLSSQGERWRDLRQTMSPIFTSSKMRSMFVLMDECAQQAINYFRGHKGEIIELEWKATLSKFSNDVIATTAFGIKCDSFKDGENEFLAMGRELTDFTGLKKLKFLLYGYYPGLAKLFKIKMITDRVGNFFQNLVNESISLREANKIVRPDLIHLLMLSRKGKLKYEDYMNLSEVGFAAVSANTNTSYNSIYLTNQDIAAQAILFYMGGYDTVSSLLSFASYELAVNVSVQKKLRMEISKVCKSSKGKTTYEQILEMKYLDMVVSETLRKWPQGLWVDRKCTKSFEIEPTGEESSLKIDVGNVVWIPVYALHRDAKYFPNPEVFDPERFNPDNVNHIQNGTYLPFGSGPRNCIGSRFALLEAKVFLYHLLQDFEIVPTDKTQIPLKIKKDSAMLLPENGFYLGLKRSVSL